MYSMFLALSLAAPVPEHLFPKNTDKVQTGLVFEWPGNDTVWKILRIEGDKAYIQCADKSGKVYETSVATIKALMKPNK